MHRASANPPALMNPQTTSYALQFRQWAAVELTGRVTFWRYSYIYWHQNLGCAEPQQVLFAMILEGTR